MSLAFTASSPGQAFRLPQGGLVDRSRPVPFTFDGQSYTGFAGDTLASALLANGVRLFGRSFKYHRPRGVVAAGTEEPNALVELRRGARREPNTLATTAELYKGLEAWSQNRFPSLRFDLAAVSGLVSPVIGAGFYYKTFMWPAAFWERVYEPLIRRAAGLGQAAAAPDPDAYDRGFLHADVLVVGGGPAGLSAARAAARAGARVLLCDDGARLGGSLLAEGGEVEGQSGPEWADAAAAELASLGVIILPRTTVFGVYDGGTYGAVERVADHLPAPAPGQSRQRYWKIVARRCVLAAGAVERPLLFPGNDRPGVMLAGAVRTYINRFAVAPGSRAVVVTAGDDGWRTVESLHAAGIEVAAIVDRRGEIAPEQASLARRAGAELVLGGRIAGAGGRLGLRWVRIGDPSGRTRRIRADLLAMAGGWNPAVGLTSHLGGRPVWDPALNAFVPGALPPGMLVAGAAAGRFGIRAALADGAAQGTEAAAGSTAQPTFTETRIREREKERVEGNPPLWLMPGKKAFVDFQHDVTAADVAIAYREGFRGVEHLKRYTTLGMGTDQGRLGNVNGLAVMAALTGRGIAETGTTSFRPPHTPVSIGALAGPHRGRHYQPTRQTPAHDWAEAQGAVFTEVGLWLRASYFPRDGEDWLAATEREVAAVRAGAGVCDVSTLGKIELTGPDVGAFLDRLYVNTFSNLRPGRVRYGLMLREDGFALDDGTVARLEEDRWLMTTTTAQAGPVLAHMEHAHQVLWPELDVQFVSVTDQWAQFAIAGPRARSVLETVAEADVSDAALPFMGCAPVSVEGVAGRVFRISFSGELAFELAVPARTGDAVVRRIVAAGAVPYGLEAMAVMRIEKGHPAGAELNGQATAGDLGMARLMSRKKDFIGRAMAQRPALVAPDRPGLVGVRPIDPAQRLRAGAHFLPVGSPNTIEHDQGWVTSVAHSQAIGSWIGLGFLAGGASRIGQRVRAYDPVRGGDTVVEVVAPCFLDPEGSRLRG